MYVCVEPDNNISSNSAEICSDFVRFFMSEKFYMIKISRQKSVKWWEKYWEISININKVGQSTSSTRYLKYKSLKYFLVLQVFKYFFKYFKIMNTKLCHYNFIIYFIFYFYIRCGTHFKGFLIRINYCFWRDRFFYTFRKIHISEMLPESFKDKFLKLLIQV